MYCILYTVYCILYTVYCVYCILYTVYCILYTPACLSERMIPAGSKVPVTTASHSSDCNKETMAGRALRIK